LENIAFKIAKSIASTLQESVLKKGYATLVVSGGNSLLPVHHLLNQNKGKIEFSDFDF
jgi:6-phosphogluconolactonase/glucosamine-6-phosphate isomerase/deaminase